MAVREVLRIFQELVREGGKLGQVFEWNKEVNTADGGGVVTYGLEHPDPGDVLAVQGREQGLLQEGIHPGFLLSGPELVDPDGEKFLFAWRGGGGGGQG